MQRNKRIVLMSHCLLNVNAKVQGLATYRGALQEALDFIQETGAGVVQLPCPEMTYCGLRRWGQTVEQYDTPFYQGHCEAISQDISRQVNEYLRNGYTVIGVIGLDGSPSCGVDLTWSGDCCGMDHHVEGLLAKGQGVLMRSLKQQFDRIGIHIPFVGLDEENPAASIGKLEHLKGQLEKK